MVISATKRSQNTAKQRPTPQVLLKTLAETVICSKHSAGVFEQVW